MRQLLEGDHFGNCLRWGSKPGPRGDAALQGGTAATRRCHRDRGELGWLPPRWLCLGKVFSAFAFQVCHLQPSKHLLCRCTGLSPGDCGPSSAERRRLREGWHGPVKAAPLAISEQRTCLSTNAFLPPPHSRFLQYLAKEEPCLDTLTAQPDESALKALTPLTSPLSQESKGTKTPSEKSQTPEKHLCLGKSNFFFKQSRAKERRGTEGERRRGLRAELEKRGHASLEV